VRRRLRSLPIRPTPPGENNEIYYRVGGWFCARLCSFLSGHGNDATGVVGQDSTGHQVVPTRLPRRPRGHIIEDSELSYLIVVASAAAFDLHPPRPDWSRWPRASVFARGLFFAQLRETAAGSRLLRLWVAG
jgi:hypothetical protein